MDARVWIEQLLENMRNVYVNYILYGVPGTT